ncbi:MAG: histidine kinase [Pseudomonadota bacterium]
MAKALSSDSGSGVPIRAVIFSMVIFWVTYFVLITFRSYVTESPTFDEELLLRLIVTVVGLFFTICLWGVLRLFDQSVFWIKISAALVLAMPTAAAIGHINAEVFEEVSQQHRELKAKQGGLRYDAEGNLLYDLPPDLVAGRTKLESLIVTPAEAMEGSWQGVIEIALGRYFLLLAWASTYFAMLAGYQARSAERREQEFRSAAKAAELRSLRYQVNPHFLFNTLNSLSALVMTGKSEQAERMIQTMSRFYRHSLADDPTADVPLKDEFDLQKLYLDIETTRFPERLVCKFDLPPDLADARVPGMILQPLVENSVKYAVSPVNRPVTITVAAREEFDRLVVTVSDDGPGPPKGVKHGFGIGLANVRDRLEARFGPDVVLTSVPSSAGYSSEIRIPLTRNG